MSGDRDVSAWDGELRSRLAPRQLRRLGPTSGLRPDPEPFRDRLLAEVEDAVWGGQRLS
jgi:hypothetical protein